MELRMSCLEKRMVILFWIIINIFIFIIYVLLKEIVEKETLIEYIGLMEKMDIDISTSKNK